MTYSNFLIKENFPFYNKGNLFGVWSNNPTSFEISKSEVSAVAISGGFLKERLSFSFELSKASYDKDFPFVIMTPNGTPITYFVFSREHIKSMSLLLSAKMIDRNKIKLYTRLSLFRPIIKSGNGTEYSLTYVDRKSVFTAMQVKLVYQNWFIQTNLMVNFNQYYLNPFFNKPEENTNATLRNLLVGYQLFQHSNSIFKNSTLFTQAVNLFRSKNLKGLYNYDSQATIGINLDL